MNFVARLRVRMKVAINAQDLPATLTVPGFPQIELKQQTRKPPACSHSADASCPVSVAPRSDGARFTFTMRGFPDEASAHFAGKRLADGLLAIGAVGNLGVDVGFDRATAQFGATIHHAVREQTGRELRSDLFGLMTFEQNSVTIANWDTYGFTSTPVQSIQAHLLRWTPIGGTMTERQRICAALLNDAFYTGQSEAQFILCISAVEALCDQRDLSHEHIKLVDGLLTCLSGLEGDTQSKRTLQRLLQYARRESLRQAYMTKLRTRLDGESAKRFDQLYKMRSGFVHDGKGRGDLQSAADEARKIAVRLLEADLLASMVS